MATAPQEVLRHVPESDLGRACLAPLARPTQILVEGREDLSVLCAIFGIRRDRCADDQLQFHSVGSKHNFGKVLLGWSTGESARYFRNELRRVVVVRDANGDPATARRDVVRQLKEAHCQLPNGEPAPDGYEPTFRFATQVVLMPTWGDPGALEDEVLATLDGDPDLALSDGWLTQAVAAARFASRSPDHAIDSASSSKARIQSFLSLFTKSNYKLIGAAFDHGILDGQHRAFDPIRQLLRGE